MVIKIYRRSSTIDNKVWNPRSFYILNTGLPICMVVMLDHIHYADFSRFISFFLESMICLFSVFFNKTVPSLLRKKYLFASSFQLSFFICIYFLLQPSTSFKLLM